MQESKCFQFPVFSISGKLVCLVHYSTQEKKKKNLEEIQVQKTQNLEFPPNVPYDVPFYFCGITCFQFPFSKYKMSIDNFKGGIIASYWKTCSLVTDITGAFGR